MEFINKMEYEIYYINKKNRLESMLLCSLKAKIDWCEEGLKFVSWEYEYIEKGSAKTLQDIFKKYSLLRYDKRRKKQYRTINMGDIILFDNEPWIISSFGFLRIPEILWRKVKKF